MLREEVLQEWINCKEKVNSLKLSEADKQNKIFQYKGYFARLERKTFEFDIFASVATFPPGAIRAKYSTIEASDNSNRTLTLKDSRNNLGYTLLHVYRVRGIVKEFLYQGSFDNDKGEVIKDEIDKLGWLPFPIASEELVFDDYDSGDGSTIEEVD